MNAEKLLEIQNYSIIKLKTLYQASIPAHPALPMPAAFWDSYVDSDEKLAIGLRACLTLLTLGFASEPEN
jgi:hypothetical protein